MYKKHSIRFSGLFSKYLLNYVILAVSLCMVVAVFFYNYVLKIYEKEVTGSNIMKLEQVKQDIDRQLLDLNQVAYKLGNDPELTPFQLLSSEYAKICGMESLEKYKTNTGILNHISLYFFTDQTELVFSTAGTMSKDYFLNKNDLSREFIKEARFIEAPELLVADSQMSSIGNYIVPKPYNGGKPYGAIFFTLDIEKMVNAMKSVFPDYSSSIFITSTAGRVIVSRLDDGQQDFGNDIMERLQKYIGEYGVFKEFINGNKTSILKVKSEYLNIEYVIVLSERDLNASIIGLSTTLTIAIVLLSLAGIALAVIMARNSYIPIKKISDQYAYPMPGSRKMDELDIIKNAIESSKTENKKLIGEISNQNVVVEDSVIISLLKGQLTSLELKQIDELRRLGIQSHYYQVICLLIDNFEEGLGLAEIATLKNEVRSCLKDSCTVGMRVHIVQTWDSNMLVALLNLEEEFSVEQTTEYILRARQLLAERSKHTITVASGNVVSDCQEIQNSFAQAKYASEYRLLRGWNSMLLFQDLVGTSEGKYAQCFSHDNILNIYKQCDIHQLHQLLEHVFLEVDSNETPENMKNEYYKFIRVLKNLCQQTAPLLEDFYKVLTTEGSRIPETKEKAFDWLLENSIAIIARLLEQKKNKNNRIKEATIEYIESSYMDNSITLESIAEQMNITVSYLSRYFKEQTGGTVMNYLDMIRLDKAKDLLVDSNLTVKEIVTQVGYVDVNNFIRKFKKTTGITPIVYRNNERDVRQKREGDNA